MKKRMLGKEWFNEYMFWGLFLCTLLFTIIPFLLVSNYAVTNDATSLRSFRACLSTPSSTFTDPSIEPPEFFVCA